MVRKQRIIIYYWHCKLDNFGKLAIIITKNQRERFSLRLGNSPFKYEGPLKLDGESTWQKKLQMSNSVPK